MSNNVIQHDWGYELIWANHNSYKGKILVFNKIGRIPMHFHKATHKTWFVNTGQFKVKWIDTKTGEIFESELSEGSTFENPSLQPVQLECIIAGSSITEVSDSYDNDLFILQRI